MAKPGAPAALRGYRVQALYTLYRILKQQDQNLIFQPEGLEDLDVFNSVGVRTELIQVKKRNVELRLSHLEPGNENSFLQRILKVRSAPPKIQLVSFCPLGKELDGIKQNITKNKANVKAKLLTKDYTDSDIDWLFNTIEWIVLDESQIETKVHEQIKKLPIGIDPANACDLLHYWIFKLMEQGRKVTYADVVKQLNEVGRWLSERDDYHKQWFSTIQPIETKNDKIQNQNELNQEFYQGSSTRYEHINADLDFERNNRLIEIDNAFTKSNIVIIHAASGQGKTTLALRYMHNSYPGSWRFSVIRIADIEHALKVANALRGFANAMQIPVGIHVDVNPRDNEWPELLRQLAQHTFLKVLVTVREEDYRRANISRIDFKFNTIELTFDKEEAKYIYDSFQNEHTQRQFVDFEAAWAMFGECGPLLEFVHLLTQTETLQQRLKSQIYRIRDEVREKKLEKDELKLLRLVSVATAYDARVSTRALIRHLNIPDPATTLHYFDQEYLFRVNEPQGCLDGLHAIRSQILVELLIDGDLDLWVDSAVEVLPFILEDDWEIFLLNTASSRFDDLQSLKDASATIQPKTWRGLAGLLRSSLWVDLNDYVHQNKIAIETTKNIFGNGWVFALNFGFTDESTQIDGWWNSGKFSDLLDGDKRKLFDKIRSLQTTKENKFADTLSWFQNRLTPDDKPTCINDWADLTFILHFAEILGIDHLTPPPVDVELPLTILADVAFFMHKYDSHAYYSWLEQYEDRLLERFSNELSILQLYTDDSCLKVEYIVQGEEIAQRKEKEPLHAASIERLETVSQFYPDYEEYGIQGYCHTLGEALPLGFDHSQKPRIRKERLLPYLVCWDIRIANNIATLQLRKNDWAEYYDDILSKRWMILKCIKKLQTGLIDYIKCKSSVDIEKKHLDREEWKLCKNLLNQSTDLPKNAVDPWGFSSETIKRASHAIEDSSDQPDDNPFLSLQIYQPYIKAQKDYFSHVRNFMDKCLETIRINTYLSKLSDSHKRHLLEKEFEKLGIRISNVHIWTHNLWEVKHDLSQFQKEFRNLFIERIDESLDKLEAEETAVMSKTWLLWHHYSHRPTITQQKPLRYVTNYMEKVKREIDRDIKRTLSRFSSNDCQATRHYADLQWNDKPALILQLNVINAVNLFTEFNRLISALHDQFHQLTYSDLKRYLIRENYENIIIIPTLCNKMADLNVWNLYALSTILNTEPIENHAWVCYPMNPISQEWLEILKFELWDLPQISLANDICIAFTQLMVLTAQVGELTNLTSLTDTKFDSLHKHAIKLVQQHADSVSVQMQECLQRLINSTIDVQNQFKELAEAEKISRRYLIEAYQLIYENSESILFLSDNGNTKHTLDDIGLYAKKLSNIPSFGVYLRLFLIADALCDHQ